MPVIVPHYQSMRYDGDNASLILEWLPNVELVAVGDDGTLELKVTAFGSTYPSQIPVGSWALRDGSYFQGSMPQEQYASYYYELPGT